MPLKKEEVSATYQAIASVTTKYTFAHPVELGDIKTVFDELVAALKPWPTVGVEINDEGKNVVVTALCEGRALYRREMIVSGYDARA